MQRDLDARLRKSRAALPHPDGDSLQRTLERLVSDVERRAHRRRAPLVTSVVFVSVLVASVAAVAANRILESRTTAAPARVVDRTLLCNTTTMGGLRMMITSAAPRHRTTYTLPARAGVQSGAGTNALNAGIETGPIPNTRTSGAAYYNRNGCRQVSARVPRPTRVRVPLTSRGLTGGAVGPLGESHKCEVPRQVLVRVRAVFTRPTSWAPNSDFPYHMQAPGTIQEGYVAVKTWAGNRPLSFASVTQTRARLFVARSCWQD